MAPSINSWDWSQPNQSELYFTEVKHKIFNLALNNDKAWRNYTGLPLGIGYGLLCALSQISLVGEQVIKGLGNIVSRTDLDRGWVMLNLASKNALHFFIGIPIVALHAFILIPMGSFFNPDATLYDYTFAYTPTPPIEMSEPVSYNDYEIMHEFVF